MENLQALLRRQRKILEQFAEIQKALNVTDSSHRGQVRNQPPSLALGWIIRKFLAVEGVVQDWSRITLELVAGKVNQGHKITAQDVQRAIKLSAEIGLLVVEGESVGLPEWQSDRRPMHRVAADKRVRAVVQKMHANPGAGTRFTSLAQESGVSPSRLSHLFQKEFSITPTEYLRRIRFRLVHHMLRTSGLKLKEILAIVGIPDRSHFSRDFKRVFQQSPSKIKGQSR